MVLVAAISIALALAVVVFLVCYVVDMVKMLGDPERAREFALIWWFINDDD